MRTTTATFTEPEKNAIDQLTTALHARAFPADISVMRALIFDGTAARLEANHPAPMARPGEAVIRVSKAAVSTIDLEICRGLLGFHGVLGREFVGVVESAKTQGQKDKATPGQKDSAPSLFGKRVVGSITTACGACDMCRGGLRAHCRESTILGLKGRDGCLADCVALPVGNLSVVPDSIDDDHAVFAVALASAIQTAGQLTIANKPHITVLGDGSQALITAQVLAPLNASVRVVGWQGGNLSLCEKWGIKHRHDDDVGRRADQDIVIECSGTSNGLNLALQLVRPRGTIVVKSLFAPNHAVGDNGFDAARIVLNEISVIGSSGGPIGEALAMLERREIDVVSLISKRMALRDGPAILRSAAQPDVIKVLVDI